MARQLLIKVIAYSTMLVLISGCGFHLRKPQPLPLELRRLYLDTSDPYSTTSIELQQLLKTMRIQLVPNKKMAPVTLSVFNESFTSSTVAKSSSAKTQQYRLHYSLSYQLQNENGEIIYGPKQVSSNRLYTVQEDQILSSSNATDALHKEMQQDTVYQLLTELGAQSVAEAMSDYEIKARTATPAS